MKRILTCLAVLAFLLGFRYWMVRNVEFTNIEHILVYRSWSMAKYGVDEFGRKTPFLFGSTDGVQLPALTYLVTPITYFFGSNLVSEQILDFIFLLIPSLFAIGLGYGCLFSLLIMANPVFFWPGNWEAKALTALLLILWKLATKQKPGIALAIVCLMSLVVSFDAWFMCPLILLIGFFYKNKEGLAKNYSNLALLISVVVFLFFIIKSNQNTHNHFKLNYFNFNQDVSILNSINTFRGQDLKLGFGLTSRLLHNKLQYIPVILGQSLSFLSPSFLFATGDKNPESNSMWIPPFLSVFLLLFAYSIYNSSHHENKYHYIWIITTTLIIGSTKFPQTEQKIYLLSIPLLLIISKSFNLIPKYIFNFFVALGIINLVSLGVLSGTVNSVYKEKCSVDLILKIADVASLDTYKNILITDDVCNDLGPGLALVLAQKPVKTNDTYFKRNLRSVGKINIVSPTDIGSDEIMKNKAIILSEKLANIVTVKLSETIVVKKQILYSGRNENYSMYMLTEEQNEAI